MVIGLCQSESYSENNIETTGVWYTFEDAWLRLLKTC